MTEKTAPRDRSKASLVAAIMIALLLYKGVGLLIQAAAMPLERVAVYGINALLLRGWRDVVPIAQTDYPLVLVGLTAFNGFVLFITGLAIGMKLVRPEKEKLAHK